MNREDRSARIILPIPDEDRIELVTYDAKSPDMKFPPILPIRPPSGAPNVLIILLDDVGFGASSAFGGPCHTPTAELLAGKGLKYNRFHTTALCSPTRQALLTGRNHHAVGMGGITELATSAPGYSSVRPDSAAPLAETLKLNGYSTAQFGKCHEIPVWETSPMGPFRQWPTGSGFEHFYGFIGGETNQYAPSVYRDTVPVEPDRAGEQGYHFTEDMTDHAIDWIRQQKALMPDKPFFVYFAPGATHAPHQVPKEWADKYKGKFDQGWDKLRHEIFARQQKLGVIPKECDLTERPEEIPAWEEMPKTLRPVLARQMEIYAGFLEHTDHQIGRLTDALQGMKILDDTLIFYILGDNGASAEGTIHGTFNELLILNGSALETVEFMASHIDKFGSPEAYNHYAVGWAHAMDTPYQWTKQVASHWGGTRNAMIVRWPAGIKSKNEVRSQFHHVIDIAPTILEAAGIPEPVIVNGIRQMPLQGTSIMYSFDDKAALEHHETQYFEMFVNRGIYHKGWTAVTRHSTPWVVDADLPAFDDDVWELYDTATDWTQAHDLSKTHPEMLYELQRLWLIEAVKFNVLPLDDRRVERFNSELAGRPELIKGKSQTLFPGMGRLQENAVLNIKNKSFSVTAEILVPESGAEGVILGQGGKFGGWSLYVKSGRLRYVYNLFGIQRWHIEAGPPIPKGKHEVCMEFRYGVAVAATASGQNRKLQDVNPLGQGGKVTLYYDGQRVGEGHVDRTVPFAFSADETADVGRATSTSPTDDYDIRHSVFNGKINWVRIDLGDQDFHVPPEYRMRIAMAKQ